MKVIIDLDVLDEFLQKMKASTMTTSPIKLGFGISIGYSYSSPKALQALVNKLKELLCTKYSEFKFDIDFFPADSLQRFRIQMEGVSEEIAYKESLKAGAELVRQIREP